LIPTPEFCVPAGGVGNEPDVRRPPEWTRGHAPGAVLMIVGIGLLWRHADTRVAFYGLLVVAPIELVVLVVTAGPLH
jgi:rhodanese-related sulfurtransferase